MEFKEKKSIYVQIADHICENIVKGIWKEGDRIASVREFAVDIEVNPNTVMRAYSYLQDEGIIYNKRGIGYFVGENLMSLKPCTATIKKKGLPDEEFHEIFLDRCSCNCNSTRSVCHSFQGNSQ